MTGAVAVVGGLSGWEGRAVAAASANVALRRRDDMLDLRLALYNLRVVAGGGRANLVKDATGRPAFIVVLFGPQSAQEYSFSTGSAPADAPVSLRLSGPSRIAFEVPDELLPLPYTTESLLRWAGFTPRLVTNAQGREVSPKFRGEPHEPGETETALEVPFGVIMSPDATGGWSHRDAAAAPVGPTGWTELWHTRLGSRVRRDGAWTVEEDEPGPVLRAVWLPDAVYPALPPDAGFTTSLTPRQRYELVRLSGDFSSATPPAPVEVGDLALSSLGAWLDADASWPGGGALSDWSHELTMGRDQRVRVAQAGFLLPFGHRAAWVQVTERVLGPHPATGTQRGYLRTRTFLEVLERERRYDSDPHMPHDGRALPFRRIQVVTRVTQDLDDRQLAYGESSAEPAIGSPGAYAFLATRGGAPLPLHFAGLDWDGRRVHFSSPVIFISEPGAASERLRADVSARYNTRTEPTDDSRTGQVGGRMLALAASSDQGDTSLEVRTLSFAMSAASLAATGVPGYPSVARITAELPRQVRALAANAGPATMEYFTGYLEDGFQRAKNAAGVYLAKAEGAADTALAFISDGTGGIVTPGIVVDGLSRTFGPVAGDLMKVAKQRFDPERMLGELEGRLLGGIRLTDVLRELTDDLPNPEQAIRTVSREVTRLEGGVRRLERVETRLRWAPELKAGPGSLNLFVPGRAGRLEIEAVTVARLLPPLDATYSVRGELSDVTINVWGDSGAAHFVSVRIRTLRFTAAKGQKPDVDCELDGVTFHGPLKYLAEIAKYCRFPVPVAGSSARALRAVPSTALASYGGGSQPFSVEVTTAQIKAELAMQLPSLSFGVFALDALRLFAGLYIPFDGSPVRLKFALNSREDPFSLTVSFLGGGGFFALEAGADGVENLEASLEAGAGTAFDVAGLVSGHVEAKIGIFFGIRTVGDGDATAQQVELSAYARISGRVSVLGLISASVDCYLALTYYSGPDRLVGEARVTIAVDLFLFETSVSFSVRRELAGGGGAADAPAALSAARTAKAAVGGARHSFADAYSPDHWSSYCAAFAPMGA